MNLIVQPSYKKMNRIINANIPCGRISNPTERRRAGNPTERVFVMGKKMILMIFITILTGCSTNCLLPVGVAKELRLCNMVKEQEFWNDYKRGINDSSGWVNPGVFRKYRFCDNGSIMSWVNNIDMSYVNEKLLHIGKDDVAIIQCSYGYGVWYPFFIVFKKVGTGWQLCTAKLFAPDYWNKIVIEQNDNKEIIMFTVENQIVDLLPIANLISGDIK